MWLIALGVNGLLGLASFVALLLLPPLAFLRRAPGRVWAHPAVAPAAVVAIAVTLYMCDSLFNAMLNPLFVVAAGGLTSIVISSRRAARAGPAQRPAAAGRQGIAGRTEPGALA
jgi:O-antigen ligase